MSYQCPRCEGDVSRGYSGSAQMTAGLAGALFYAAFGAFQCAACGKLARSEFPKEDRTKMALGSLVMVVAGLGIVSGAVWYLGNVS